MAKLAMLAVLALTSSPAWSQAPQPWDCEIRSIQRCAPGRACTNVREPGVFSQLDIAGNFFRRCTRDVDHCRSYPATYVGDEAQVTIQAGQGTIIGRMTRDYGYTEVTAAFPVVTIRRGTCANGVPPARLVPTN